MAKSIPVTDKQQPTFEDLELLVEVSQLLTLHDLNEVMEEVMRLAASAVGAQRPSLFLHNGFQVDWNHIFTARNLEEAASIKAVSAVIEDGLAGWVVKNKQAGIVDDTATDDRWHVFPDDPNPVGSAICIPLMFENEVVALLTLVHPETYHFNEYHLRLLTIIANQSTVAIRNAQLFQRVREKQEQLAAVLQSVPDVLLVMDENGDLIMINDGAKEFLELEVPEDAIGKHLTEFPHRSIILDEIENRVSHSEDFGMGISFEARAPKIERDFAVNISAWEERESNRRGYVVIMHDVTTLKDLYRFKDEMLRIISHDLRSPLSIISGYTDMIEYDAEEGTPVFDFTDAIKRSVARMGNLLEDLLQVRKIDEKGLHLDTDVVMIDLVRPVIQGVTMLAQQKKQTIKSDIQIDDSLMGTVDITLLRQAMDNLASNAVKYTPEGGKITLRAYTEDRDFHFEVEDNGIGIPESSIPHLFESFYRVNPGLNTTISGAGLGLSLVKSIIERHKGKIWVESEEGVGSTFGLCIPLDR